MSPTPGGQPEHRPARQQTAMGGPRTAGAVGAGGASAPASEQERFDRYQRALVERFFPPASRGDPRPAAGAKEQLLPPGSARRSADAASAAPAAEEMRKSGFGDQGEDSSAGSALPQSSDLIARGELERRLQEQRRELEDELKRCRQEHKEDLRKRDEDMRARVEEAARCESLREAALARQRAAAERQAAEDRAASEVAQRRARAERWGLASLLDTHVEPAGLADRFEQLLARLDGLSAVAGAPVLLKAPHSGTAGERELRHVRGRALGDLAWVLSGELYELLAEVRASHDRQGSDLKLPSDEFNNLGIGFSTAINERVLAGIGSVESVPEGVIPRDALHYLAADIGASDPLRPATVLLKGAAGEVLQKAHLVRRTGGPR